MKLGSRLDKKEFHRHSKHSHHHTCPGILYAPIHHIHHQYTGSNHSLSLQSHYLCLHHTSRNKQHTHSRKPLTFVVRYHHWPSSWALSLNPKFQNIHLHRASDFASSLSSSSIAFCRSACFTALSSCFFLCASCLCSFICLLSCFFHSRTFKQKI